MRYIAFTISNFKGIQNLKLNLDANPASKIFIFVGLNESGKTTIMEALSFFYENIRDINESDLTLHPSGIIDKHSLIPKNRKDNFTDSTVIKAELELEEKDITFLAEVLKDNDFSYNNIEPQLSISFEFKFENSSFIERKVCFKSEISGHEKRKKKSNLSSKHKAWNPAYQAIRKIIPPIIYYPNFLFEFPDVIYLDEYAEEGKEQAFYRRLLQDVLDSLNNRLTLQTHIIERAISGKRQDRESLNSVLNKMSSQITKLVFSENLSVFRSDTRNKSIIVSYPELDEKNQVFYVELQLKDGEDSYYIRERSLGFRWFFTFLLFTQFRVQRSQGNTNLVFLFDEPASNLHQEAQQRLLSALEELTKSSVSVIYSTHSHHLINPQWLESAFIVRNKALEYEKDDIDNFEPTNIEVQRYRAFINQHPNQQTYYQPILDVLEYRPSNLETVIDVIMLEGKNDFYTLSYFQEIIIKPEQKLAFLPGTGSGSLDTVIRLYSAWGRNFIVLLDSDAEGRKQKTRYQEVFKGIIQDRLFLLEDVDNSWSNYAMEKLFDSNDLLNIQKSVFAETQNFDKKQFNIAIQENLAKRVAIPLSNTTIGKFKKLLNFLNESLAKSS
ncbi:DNA replication and repair protein RecF [Anabaenopsis circularis NIES-21]|uniref:DNA replication and repair protein RecF n=1 Tax=Anabaenopsis circularis NIES-21 TaxID=1085406 RepID=A0A1Z4GE84_9CYAN|nr:DNA replication and repair protein RecF [Anabaenopsis circularis NIES-21]